MPNHDYRCPECGWILFDQYRSIAIGGQGDLPTCFNCDRLMEWIIPVPRTDLRSDGEGSSGKTFQKFVTRDGQDRLIEIDSLHKLREVERESEKMAADGVGQPIRFRAYAQDSSNLSVNTFGERDTPALSPAAKRKWGLRGATKAVDAPTDGSAPEYNYGPGVNDSNTSPLVEG